MHVKIKFLDGPGGKVLTKTFGYNGNKTIVISVQVSSDDDVSHFWFTANSFARAKKTKTNK